MSITKCLITSNMIQEINAVIRAQNNGETNSKEIFVIDYKKINGGDVEILSERPEHDCVILYNERNIFIHYVAFKENALRVNTPQGQVKQCECILFPKTLNETDWILCIETKYTENLKIALDEKVDYPNTMIHQIISTVKYFRDKQIIPENKKVHAIVSFPKLIESFSEAFFTRSEMTREEILEKYKIILRPSNEAVIKSKKTIKI